MKRLPIILALLLIVSSCATQHKAIVPPIVSDSVRVEMRYKTIESIDTVFVTLPPQTMERVIPDTTSTLENDYAKSTASILPNGLLSHRLETKQQPVPVPVKNKSEQRDGVVIREVETSVPYPVEVEVNHLTRFQQVQIYGFRVLVAIAALGLIIRYRKGILAFISRLYRLIR